MKTRSQGLPRDRLKTSEQDNAKTIEKEKLGFPRKLCLATPLPFRGAVLNLDLVPNLTLTEGCRRALRRTCPLCPTLSPSSLRISILRGQLEIKVETNH